MKAQESIFAEKITRFKTLSNRGSLKVDREGRFVLYEDYLDAIEQLQQENAELREAALAAIHWIDSVPGGLALPTMPGVDRDWFDSVVASRTNVCESELDQLQQPVPAGLRDICTRILEAHGNSIVDWDAMRELQDMINATPQPPEPRQWVSVKDDLPNTSGTVLIFTDDEDVVFGWIDRGDQWRECSDDIVLSDGAVTHWMPLPSAPQEQREGER